MTMLAASERKTSPSCSSVRRPRSGPSSLRQKSLNALAVGRLARDDGRRRSPGEKVRRDGGKVLAFEFGGRVHPAHRRFVDGAFELGERGPGLRQALREVGAVEQHRVVAGEVLAIVVEHRRSILVDLGIGRIDVDDVDLAAGDGLVREAVIEAARRVEWQRRSLRFNPGQPSARPMNSCESPSRSSGCRLEVGQGA